MSRSTAPIAIRGSSFRLRRDGSAGGGWCVEQVGDDRVEAGRSFTGDDVAGAVDFLDRSYLSDLSGDEDAGALRAALQWGLAHRAGDVAAIGELMAEGSALHDHRHLGLGEVARDRFLTLLDAQWETNSVALVAEYEQWSDRAALARVVYVGRTEGELIDDSESYTVFAVEPLTDGTAVITRMDVYDGNDDGRTAARSSASTNWTVTPPDYPHFQPTSPYETPTSTCEEVHAIRPRIPPQVPRLADQPRS